MALNIARDPVLRLLPTPPEAFEHLSDAEQAWRGRLWITLYGAGYEQDHAWWFAMSDESNVAEMKATIAQVPDDHFPAMLQGRLALEQAKAIQPDVAQ